MIVLIQLFNITNSIITITYPLSNITNSTR